MAMAPANGDDDDESLRVAQRRRPKHLGLPMLPQQPPMPRKGRRKRAAMTSGLANDVPGVVVALMGKALTVPKRRTSRGTAADERARNAIAVLEMASLGTAREQRLPKTLLHDPRVLLRVPKTLLRGPQNRLMKVGSSRLRLRPTCHRRKLRKTPQL